MTMKLAQRTQQIEPFYAMELAKHAYELAATLMKDDAPMIHLTLGEPDFTAPALVQQAATDAAAPNTLKHWGCCHCVSE